MSIFNKLRHKIRNTYLKYKYRNTIYTTGSFDIGKGFIVNRFRDHGHLQIHMAPNTRIKRNVIVQGSGILHIGLNSYISSFCVIGVNESISIGENVMIADSVSIRDTDHAFDRTDIPMKQQGITTKPIVISDDVWIGYGAVITKGITIGQGAIIGANAVVTKDVAPFTIVGGVPAKLIKVREQ